MVKLQKSDLIKATGVTPAVNQIERHLLLVQTGLMDKKYSADLAQVLILWGAKGGISVIPKSINPKRIDSNFISRLPGSMFQ
ncbi:hypothetical protein PPACK8108_LOCUS8243 [Phakopsora pachyrhizi]|uniref:Uncharacterized protein n=1 Tax=Phakopsora pachyrhizi TaxID=170000 RepID=A0AAV0AV62_PHAPC|nr:hypothetical protein PPACK8108_LOCUS7651 [Phakopsora pachyrhizi]CAH7673394.1 hypothetical protein PPACK8108_LOCUS8243 [Phakopsora pachyrhizi]